MPRRLFALLLVSAFADSSLAQKNPEEALRSLKVADGLQVELFAAEPMLLNPTSIDVDHLGRVWVCEGVNYRRLGFKRPILRDEGDRIVILTDKDGDGKADDSTVFYQGKEIIAPLGICVAASPASPKRERGDPASPKRERGFSYKVFVCQSPDILLFEDDDGDGKADGPPKKFLTGFNGFDHDHGVHGITIGPDGKLYFTVGDSGVKGLKSSDGKGRSWTSNTTDCRAGTVWRCDFDGTNLELIAHNFRNNYEACVNSFGEVWLSDNDDDGNQQTRICFVMPGGNYGYHPRGPGQSHWHEEQPGVVHKALRAGFGSPTGICFYEGTLLPEKYRGQLLHTDAGPRELRCFHIKPKGAGYELTQENLVTSTDNWFRLSDVCVAPDGSLILADWYDPGVGGHGMGDWTRGRIYRVTPKGHKGYKVPEVKLETAEGFFDVLKSPNLATRGMLVTSARNAQDGAEIIGHIAKLQAIEKLQAKRSDLINARLICYADFLARTWVFQQPTPNTNVYGVLFRSIEQNPEKLRVVKYRQNAQWTMRPAERLTLFQNATAAERRELAIGNRTRSLPDRADFFFDLAKFYDGQDHFYRAALNIACGTDPERRKAILADFDKHFPEWNDKVADLVWELRPASVLPRLGKLLDDPKLTPAQKGRIVDILAVNDDLAAGLTMLTVLTSDAAAEVKARALDHLRLFLPTKWKGLQTEDTRALILTTDRLLSDPNPKTVVAGLQLVAAAGNPAWVGWTRKLASDEKQTTEVRTEAVRTLGKLRSPGSVETLKTIATEPTRDPAPPLKVEAVNAIAALISGQSKDEVAPKALAVLQGLVTETSAGVEMQKVAVAALAGTRLGTQWLLDQHAAKKLPEPLVGDVGRLVRNSPHQDLRNKALLAFPAPGKLDPRKLPSPVVLATKQGDVKRGEAVFKASLKGESQCLRCHMVRGVGGNIGPDLSMIGKKASKENLFESVLVPSKAIADQHLQWKVTTLDEKSVIGLLVAESEKEITLRDANGKDHTFATKDLDGPKQKSLVSIMPDNLVAALTEDELIDMVEYMLTLKTASLSPESWSVMGPFIRTGDDPLSRVFGPEKAAFDPKATFPEWNGPSSGPKPKDLAWRTIRPDAKGYVDLAAFHGNAGQHSLSYLNRAVESPVEQSAEILIGSDDGCVVFVNGKEVLRENVTRAAAPEQNRVTVKLKAGKNEVLVKIANGNNPHGLYFALTSEHELKLSK